jgi:hypothetical protein
MYPEIKQISEVVVKAKRKRYKNKNRTSVQIIEKVIANKNINRPESFNYLSYEKYQKTVFSFDNLSAQIKENKLLEPFNFIFKNEDTTMVSGKTLIPVYIKESLSDCYFRKNPLTSKEIITSEKLIRFDEQINRRSVSASINFLYKDINVYNNNIALFSNQFLSPIAAMAPSFYKYFIKDTLMVNGIACIQLAFEPRNKTDLLFEGYLYITLDSTYAVKKIDMSVNKDINLNWVRNVKIVQEYEKTEQAGWMLQTDEMGADFGITQESFGVYGKRTTVYKNCRINHPAKDSIYNGMSPVYLEESENRDQDYWDQHRFLALRPSEKNIYVLMDSLKQVPQFKRNVAIISTLSGGFIKAKWFEFGLYSTFYSYNPIEGSRFKIGGRTTPLFSKKINLDMYVAYGLLDKKYKYNLGVAYSFTNKTINEFPVKDVKVSYQHDIKIPGQELLYTQDDNFLLSLKRGTNNKMYYNKVFRVEHINEFKNHFSYNLSYEYSSKTPAGMLFFNTTDYTQQTNNIPNIDISQVGLTLRYAPHEKFFQGTVYRAPFVNKYPVFQLRYTLADKFIGSDYTYHDVRLNINKRFYFSIFGYTDVSTEFGKIFGRVPYLLLDIHRANQSYTYQPQSYNLMNFLEFVSDQYASANIDHCFNGFFLNKVPGIKKLMFREVITFKALYGNLTNNNNPAYHTELFHFPTNDAGVPNTYNLDKKPYIEAGIGISNIFRVFRIDYIKRLSYLDHPDISTSGIRFSFKFDF